MIKTDISVEIDSNKVKFETIETIVAFTFLPLIMEENEEYPWRPGPNHNPELGNKKGNDMVIKYDIWTFSTIYDSI